MSLLGRESQSEQQRADRLRQWAGRRTPYALFSCLLAMIAVLDFFTVFLGFALGFAAIVLGVLGLRDIERQNQAIHGRKLCITGIALGAVAIVLSSVIGYYYFFYSSTSP